MSLRVSSDAPALQFDPPNAPLSLLPQESILHILSFVPPRELIRTVRLIAKPLALWALDRQLWSLIWSRYFEIPLVLKTDEAPHGRFFQEYRFRQAQAQNTQAVREMTRGPTSCTQLAAILEKHATTTVLKIVRKEGDNLDVNLIGYEKQLSFLEEFSLEAPPNSFWGITSSNLALFFQSQSRLRKVTLQGLAKVDEAGLVAALQKRPELTHFELVQPNLTDRFLAALASLKSLQSLKLTGKQTFSWEQFLSLPSNLRTLHWHVYNSSWTASQWSVFFKAHPQLSDLSFYIDTPLQDDFLAALSLLPLTRLVIYNASLLTTEKIKTLLSSPKLTYASLSKCSAEVRKYVKGKGCAPLRNKFQENLLIN